MNYLDFNSNTYEAVNSTDSSLYTNTLFGNDDDFINVQTDGGNRQVKRETPTFQLLFENEYMFHPEQHRSYLVYGNLATHSGSGYDSYGIPYGWEYINWLREDLAPFDKSKIELQTVTKDDKLNNTFSTDFVSYLKTQDEAFVTTMTALVTRKEDIINVKIPGAQKSLTSAVSSVREDGQRQLNEFNADLQKIDNEVDSLNTEFKNFVSDMSNDTMALNKPFVHDNIDENGIYHGNIVNITKVDSHELDKVLNTIFGDITKDGFYPVGTTGKPRKNIGVSGQSTDGTVTDDDIGFVPSANQIIYENKIPTTCCLQMMCKPNVYRDATVDYVDSKDFIEDSKQFEEYKQSDDYLLQPKRTDKLKETDLTSYVNNLKGHMSEAMAFARSPLFYVLNKFSPYLFNSAEQYLQDEGISFSSLGEEHIRLKLGNVDIEVYNPNKYKSLTQIEQHLTRLGKLRPLHVNRQSEAITKQRFNDKVNYYRNLLNN